MIITSARTWLFTLVATVGFAAYGGLVLHPGQRSISMLRRDLREKKHFISNMNQEAASLAELDQSLGRILERIERWRHSSPSEPNLVELLGKVSQLAADEKLQILRFMPQAPTAMAAIRQHPLTLELEGDYSDLMAFLGRVEQLPETVWVRQIHLRPNAENRENVQCELMLSVFADNCEISG